mgnify:FL=1
MGDPEGGGGVSGRDVQREITQGLVTKLAKEHAPGLPAPRVVWEGGPPDEVQVAASKEQAAEERDRVYSEGCASVYCEFLMAAVRGLGRPAVGADATPDQLRARIGVLEAERSASVAALRVLCAEYGDNDWTDDHYLPQVIEDNLGRYLEASDG